MTSENRAVSTAASGMKEYVEQIRTLVDDEDLVRRNRTAIVETATKLFHKKGYHNTSTRDIAKAAGVSVGSLYQYFRHKEDLMVLILQAFMELIEENIIPIADAEIDPVQKLDRIINKYYRLLDQNHVKTSILYHQSGGMSINTRSYFNDVEDMVHDKFGRIIKEGMESGVFQKVNAEFMAHNIVSMGHMWALKRRRFRGVMTVADYIEQQQAHVRALLFSPEGIRRAISC